MKWTRMLSMLLVAGSTMIFAPSCKNKPTDAEIKAKVETAVANSSVNVDVSEGVVTLGGTVADDAAKSAAESSAKTVDGVKSVTNNLSVMPPPAPVVIADDAALTAAVNEAIKAYNGVSATVNDGVVTLTGTIKRADLQTLMPAIQALKPKSVDNKLTVN